MKQIMYYSQRKHSYGLRLDLRLQHHEMDIQPIQANKRTHTDNILR